jgi:hypothetical protein
MPGWLKDAKAVEAEIEKRETERLRRANRDELLAQRDRIMAKIEEQLRFTYDPELAARFEKFKKETSWIEQNDPLTRALLDAADPARQYRPGINVVPVTAEERPSRRRPLLDFYKRIFARKAGSRGFHGEDDHGVLPEGGAAVSGGTAGGPPASGEPDADAGGTAERDR